MLKDNWSWEKAHFGVEDRPVGEAEDGRTRNVARAEGFDKMELFHLLARDGCGGFQQKVLSLSSPFEWMAFCWEPMAGGFGWS